MENTPETLRNYILAYSAIVATLSLLVAFSALIFSFFNFRRDKYKVLIDLDWDNGKRYEGMRSNIKETWGAITVRNIGRRPVYITLVGLKYPDDEVVYNLLSEENSEGIKLQEHDKPINIKVPQDQLLKKYSQVWNKIYAVAYDVSGKEYKSEKPWSKPSWVD